MKKILALLLAMVMLGNIQNTVIAPLHSGECTEFIGVTAGLHTEMANGLKGNILRQHADIEDSGLFDHLSGQIFFLHGNRQLGGLVGHLEAGIANTAIIFFRFPGA